MWYCHDRYMDQWKRSESPKINPHIYRQLIFNRDAKTIQWGKNILTFKWSWDDWISRCKRINLDLYLMPFTKINSICITDLNIRPKTIKLLQENIDINLVTWIRQWFLSYNIKRTSNKREANKIEFIKIKNFCIPKNTIEKVKR